jgi:hypothetical protein
MCVRVPEELQASLLKEVRSSRLRASVLYFPVLLVIFSALGGCFLFVKGHAVVMLLRHLLGDVLSEQSFWLLLVGVMVLGVAVGLVYFLRQMCRECSIEHHRFCTLCKAVDSDDEGHCPICRRELSEEAGFFTTSHSEEKKLLERYGLLAYTEA